MDRLKHNLIKKVLMIALLIGCFVLSSCSAGSSPSETVEGYIMALADKDEILAVNLSCAAWEEQALAEGASFKSVEVVLENLDCQVDSEENDTALVSCVGKFIFSYDAGEDQELDLEGRIFKVTNESGDWRMCGYGK